MNYRLIRNIHNYTSVVFVVLVIFFTLTGVTLNHRDWFSAQGISHEQQLSAPQQLIAATDWQKNPLSGADSVVHWLTSNYGLEGGTTRLQWDQDEQLMTLDIKRPGGYSSVEFSPSTAEIIIFNQANGLVPTLNDLHMGRSSGPWWRLVIDLTAVVMMTFIISGILLVLQQKKRRYSLLFLSSLGAAITFLGYWIALVP